jgi:hypothetical protein
MEKVLKYYIYLIFLTWAIVDVITGVCLRYNFPILSSFSLGLVTRMPFLIILIITSLYYSKKKNQILLVFSLLIISILSLKFLFIQNNPKYLQTLFKIISIIFFIPTISHFKEVGFLNNKKIRKIILINGAVISGNILLALLGIGFNKYGTTTNGSLIGSSGFFYAGNELNTAVVLLLAITLLYQVNKSKINFFYIFIFFILLSLISLSKTLLIGVLIVGYIYWSTYYKTNFLLIFLSFIILLAPIFYYVSQLPSLSAYIDGLTYLYHKNDNFLDFITSGRYSRLSAFNKVNFTNNYDYLFWGTSISNQETFTFEMDYFDLIFYNGLLGILLLIIIFKQVGIQLRKFTLNPDRRFIFRIFLLFNIIAFAAGHSFASQMALPYLVFLIVYSEESKYNSSIIHPI